MSARVILVDENDNAIGEAGKMEAHEKGKLHRAFSVFVFNQDGRLMMQQRARSKYHSGGLWSNTCCSHPEPGEEIGSAAERRLKEEMGIECKLEPIFEFQYRAELDHGLTENEYDHVFIGTTAEVPKPDPDEVEDWKWIGIQTLIDDLQRYPHQFTEWFKLSIGRVIERHKKLQKA